MIVHEVEQMLARIEVPRLVTTLPLESVCDFVHVVCVHGTPQALVALIVRHAVAGIVVHPYVVVTKHGFAQKQELLAALFAQLVGNLAKVTQEPEV